MGYGQLAFMVGLWWGLVDVWPCGAYMVRVGVFSLCGCQMMSGLLPRIHLFNFVSCISLKFSCSLLIEPLTLFPYLHFFA